ncbi:MAG: GlxA family transcriptional regulator, partial [Boseongicola sp.]|nr:GlxA family transcriptional regulator [Boseongicola sp.]
PVPGFAIMSYASVADPLRAANLLSGKHLYDILHFAHETVAKSSGSAAIADCQPLGSSEPVDLLLVIAGGDPFALKDKSLFEWLKRQARSGIRIGGVSGGPVILARAGLMDGKRMTVHWEHEAELSGRFTELQIEKRLYVIDRDRVTCGGGTAPLDFIYAMLSDHHGADFARKVSDWFLHTEIRAATSPQQSGALPGETPRTPHIQPVIAAMQDHIGDPLSLEQLALIAGISARQLNRVFLQVLDASVMHYYRGMRLKIARRLVRTSAMGFAAIAEATGFSSSAHFSAAYNEFFGCRPSTDRKQASDAAD